MMSAVIVPPVLTILETVTPFDGFALVIETVTPPAPLSVSPAVAICELDEAEPCCRVTPVAASMVGGVFGVGVGDGVGVGVTVGVGVGVTVGVGVMDGQEGTCDKT